MASKIPVYRNALSTKPKESFLKASIFSIFSLKFGFSVGFGRLCKTIRRAAAQKKKKWASNVAEGSRVDPFLSFGRFFSKKHNIRREKEISLVCRISLSWLCLIRGFVSFALFGVFSSPSERWKEGGKSFRLYQGWRHIYSEERRARAEEEEEEEERAKERARERERVWWSFRTRVYIYIYSWYSTTFLLHLLQLLRKSLRSSWLIPQPARRGRGYAAMKSKQKGLTPKHWWLNALNT